MSLPTPPDSTPQGPPLAGAPAASVAPATTTAATEAPVRPEGFVAPEAPAGGAPANSGATSDASSGAGPTAGTGTGTKGRKAKAPRNTVGLIAFITAIVGFIFACIPGALIIGWVLLPVSFILSLVSFFMKGKGKGLGVTALIVSVVGTIVGFAVFFGTLAAGIDDAFSGDETTISAPADELEATAEGDPAPEPEAGTEAATEGTREAPLPIGSAITQGDWTVTVNSVNLNAADAIAGANQFNDPAPEGSVYVLVDFTATYNGTDTAGSMPFASIEFVTPGGNTLKSYESAVMTPNGFDSISTLYAGASATGDTVFTVPAADAGAGTLAVSPTMLGDKVFVAVQ